MKNQADLTYDVFVSYRWVDPDQQWVRNELVPSLERAGLTVCLDVEDFVPGRNLILEMDRAGSQSRRAICVLSPDYFEGNRLVDFESLMARRFDPSGQQSRLIPLVLRQTDLPEWIRDLISIDWTNPDNHAREWKKLLRVLEAPNPNEPAPESVEPSEIERPLSRPKLPRRFKRKPLFRRMLIPSILAVCLLCFVIWLFSWSEYDFEVNEMGWIAQDYPGSLAIRHTFHSGEYAKSGTHSLGVNVRLVGGDASLDQGEVYVNMLRNPPRLTAIPVDLEGTQIRMWLYIPDNVVKGSRVGGVQLFLKDKQWNSLYGRYVDLASRIGIWFVLTLVLGKEPLEFAFESPGFNPKEVIAMGLKLDACGEKGCLFEGNIFIDSASW